MKHLLVDKYSGPNIKVNVKDVLFGGNEKVVISGPCSVESYEQMDELAYQLNNIGVNMLRGGAFKPRTSPYDFQGLKREGIKILKSISEKYNMPVVTEIMDIRDLEILLPNIDMLQIGSRNMYNYSLLKEVGKLDVPVLLKRGMSATIKEWMYAAEYIMSEGNEKIVLCERGIRTFETYTRNTLDINAVAVVKNKFRLPIIVDPSHGTGLREIVYNMSLASIAAGADGLIIESHINPDLAISDARQTVDVETIHKIIKSVKKMGW